MLYILNYFFYIQLIISFKIIPHYCSNTSNKSTYQSKINPYFLNINKKLIHLKIEPINIITIKVKKIFKKIKNNIFFNSLFTKNIFNIWSIDNQIQKIITNIYQENQYFIQKIIRKISLLLLNYF